MEVPCHTLAMGTKMASAFANILMAMSDSEKVICSCGQTYIGETARKFQVRVK